MFMTRCPINTSRRDTRKLIENPYAMHSMIAAAFPTTDVATEGRILWRIDTLPNKSKMLYIVSPTRPSMIGIEEQIGFCDLGPQSKTVDYDEFLASIENGRKYRFRLLGNTVHKVKCPDGKTRMLAHVTNEHRLEWLTGRDGEPNHLARAGLRPESNGAGDLVMVTDTCDVTTRKHDAKHKKTYPITLSGTQFDGVCTVTDADACRRAMTNGVGRAKAFGFGLLTLVPLD